MKINVVGVDCATDPKNVGLAFGTFSEGSTFVKDVRVGSSKSLPADVIAEWVRDRELPVLIALDAPLGWPVPLADALYTHLAGAGLSIPAHDLFRRRTDIIVREKIGKQSLDIGADRIARTAHAALQLLVDLRERLNEPIPLAWDPRMLELGAIEVYPAATLAAHGIPSRGYKKANMLPERNNIASMVGSLIDIQTSIPEIAKSSDGLDAVICLLSAHDFLLGTTIPAPKDAPVQREGWIWVLDPTSRPYAGKDF